MKKVYIAIILFILAFAVPVTVYSVVTGQFDIRNQAAEEASDNTSAPQIVSVPVTEAYVGEEYNYIVKAVDSDLVDVDALDYMVEEIPGWLEWNESRNMFTGIPEDGDVGSNNVALKVSDGKWLATQTFVINVMTLEGEEELDSNTEAEESTTSDESSSSEDPTSQEEASQPESDFEPVAETTVLYESDGLVLGESDELPQTSTVGILMGLSLGFAILVLALYLWLDAKYRFTEKIGRKLEYAVGKQTRFKLDNGLEVRRRKSVSINDFDRRSEN